VASPRRHAQPKKGNPIVPKLLNSKRTVIGSLLGVALIGGGAAGVAFGYPAGVPLTVAATADSSGIATVTVTNANPGCDTQVEIDGHVVGTIAANNTTTQTGMYPVSGTGRHKVSARTLDCQKGQKEHANS
jgi:hypothetical protein